MTTILKQKKAIIAWLERYNIKNYHLIKDNMYGYVVDVDNSVNLSNCNLKEISVKFNCVKGYFDCSFNQLTSLKGSPFTATQVRCLHNQLASLEHCPIALSGDFNCSFNKLETLENIQKTIYGSFFCHNNNLISLKGCPVEIKGDFVCYDNNLEHLLYFPQKVEGYIYIENNPKLDQFQNVLCIDIYNEHRRQVIENDKKNLEKKLNEIEGPSNIKVTHKI